MLPTHPTPLPPGKLFIPVLHLVTPPGADSSSSSITTHVLSQALVAVANGADGLALCPAEALPNQTQLAVAAAVAEAFPATPLIVNLMAPVADALHCVPPFAHLWTDRGVDGRGEDAAVSAALAASPLAARREGWRGTWLAGFFHKGSQRDISSLSDDALAACARAIGALSDVPVTSGAGTGVPPVADELARLCRALFTSTANVTRLASASGTTLENVGALLPFIDVFLVATGIERDASEGRTRAFYEECGLPAVDVGYLDPLKTRALADAIHGYQPLVRVGLIADIQYSTHDNLHFREGQIAWGATPPWPLVYDWPSTRRYKHSLEVLKRSLAVWHRWGVADAVVLGDILDKTTLGCRCAPATPSCRSLADNEVDACVDAVKSAFLAEGGATYHFLFGNGDAQILKRRGWVERGFAHGFERPEAHPLRTASTLYYSTSPAPGARFIFLDTYDMADGRPGGASPQDAGAVACEASSAETWALAKEYLATNPFVDEWGEASWRKYAAHFTGDARAEAAAYSTQRYNGGVGPAQLQWLEQELTSAQAGGQAVFVFGHCPAHPFSCKPDGVMWRASDFRNLLQRFSCVQAYVAGHDHDGGHVFEGGVHYIVPPAPLESEEDECGGIIALAADSWRLEWWGKTPQSGCGTMRGGAWPSWRQLPFRARAAGVQGAAQ